MSKEISKREMCFIISPDGLELGRGITNLNKEELVKVCGKKRLPK
jgi:hypothetical protein